MGEIRLIVGLGNPGRRYSSTRHNIGFMVLDELERKSGASSRRQAHRAQLSTAEIEGQKVMLAWPQTYMNDSGQAVSAILGYYKIEPEQMLVVFDDLDLSFGRIRIRPNGSAGGHNGIRSIIDTIRTRSFPRVRVGIGRPTRGDPIDYVLGKWSKEEREALGSIIGEAESAIRSVIARGVENAMNEFNGRR